MRTTRLALLLLVLAGCMFPTAPVMAPFADGKDFVLHAPMPWVIGEDVPGAEKIVVPRGFVTDLASIPKAFHSFLSPFGRHGRAAILHDYLYWDQGCTKAQADALMERAMVESGVCTASRAAIMLGLSTPASQTAWDQNTAQRAQGLPRIIPDTELIAIPTDATWPAYRLTLFDDGVRPAPRDPLRETPSYCGSGLGAE